jgi:tetratricopeptide (TPR) repeat protein
MEPLTFDADALNRRIGLPGIREDLSTILITDGIGILSCYLMGRERLMELTVHFTPSTADKNVIANESPRARLSLNPVETLAAFFAAGEDPMTTVHTAGPDSVIDSRLRQRLDACIRARSLYIGYMASAQAGRAREASSKLEEAVGICPENGIYSLHLSDYYAHISRSLAGGGRHDEAINVARRAVEVNPTSHTAFHNLGFVELVRDPPTSIAAAERAIELNPYYVQAYLLKAEGELSSGRAEDASRTLGTVLSMEPFNARARHLRALSLIRRNMLEEGRAELEVVIESAPHNTEAIEALAYAWLLEGDLDQAQNLYERVLRLRPENMGALNNYATILAEKGEYGEAIKVWTKALGLDPGNRDIIANIAEARQKMRRK